MSLEEKIASHQATIGVIGMGYIGLSLLEVFGSKGFPLVGYDSNTERVDKLNECVCPMNFINIDSLFDHLKAGKFEPSSDPTVLKKADVLVISVPTSLDDHSVPDFSSLRKAFRTVSSLIKKDLLIILQSTTYPGTTVEELLPLLEKSGLTVGEDFFLAYAPEISDPGNLDYRFADVPRLVSGVTERCLNLIDSLYRNIGCEVVHCSGPNVAEAAKIFQNTYRLINISFVNEMKMMFDRMGMDVWEVINAASSKPFGFTPFYPSRGVGGDCIPVDPVYLIWKAKSTQGPTSLIEIAENINEMMPHFVVEKVVSSLNHVGKSMKDAKVLLLGVGFKKDVDSLQQSASLKILSLLKSHEADVSYQDPLVDELHGLKMKSVPLDYPSFSNYDAIVIATDHSVYDWKQIVQHSSLIIDTCNATAQIPDAKEKVVKA